MIMLGAAVSLKTLFHLRFLIFLLMMTLNVIRFVQRKWNSGFCFPSASSATKRKQGTGNKPLCRIFQEAQVDLETQNISGAQRAQLKSNSSFHTHCFSIYLKNQMKKTVASFSKGSHQNGLFTAGLTVRGVGGLGQPPRP